MTRRRHRSARAVAWWLLAMAALSVLALAEFIVSRAVVFVPAAAVAVAGAYVLGRRHGSLRPSRPAGTRRLEAAQRERLAAELEALANRSLSEIVDSYRVIARRYQGGRP